MPVTMAQVAKLAGVSKPVVSKVLHGGGGNTRVGEETRRRVLEAVRQTGYRPSASARAMAQRRSRQVGVLVPNNPGNRFTHPLAYETILGVNEGLQAAGYVVALARIDDVRRDLADQSRVFKEHVLDGMIVLDSMPADVERRLEELIGTVVWCDSNVWREHGCLRRDEREAGRLAGQAAADLGYRRITMMTYAPPHRVHFSALERYEGVRGAVTAAGLELHEALEPGIGEAAARRELVRTLRPDAVIVCNSIYQAHAVRDIANEAGRVPGRDFGLISCDDMHQLDRMWPGLTRVTFDRYQMGVEAAALMRCVLDRGRRACPSVRLPCRLVAGDTARRQPRSAGR